MLQGCTNGSKHPQAIAQETSTRKCNSIFLLQVTSQATTCSCKSKLIQQVTALHSSFLVKDFFCIYSVQIYYVLTSQYGTYLVPAPELLHICYTHCSLIFLQRRLNQNYIKLAVQLLHIKSLKICFKVHRWCCCVCYQVILKSQTWYYINS